MAFYVKYDKENECVIGNYIGKMALEDLQEYSNEVMRVASRHACKRLMNDLSKSVIIFDAFQIYERPQILITDEYDRSWKRAVLISENANNLDDFVFYEAISRNEGYTVKIFFDRVKAMNWLTSNSRSSEDTS